MKKAVVLALLMTLNIGAVAQDLIFSDDFESGWPNAWAQVYGWSAFVVRDSTGALVGPVVGFVLTGDWKKALPETPLVAFAYGGEKIVMKVAPDGLTVSRPIYFSSPGCTGQVMIKPGTLMPGGQGTSGVFLADLQQAAYAIGLGNVLYRAEPPAVADGSYMSRTDSSGMEDWTNACAEETGAVDGAWPATVLVDLDTLFIPPFFME